MRLVHRSMSATDRPFVLESWISSYRRSPHAGLVSMHEYHEMYERIVSGILARSEVKVLVAADADATDNLADIFGWLAWMVQDGRPVVFYVYCKHSFRKNGIARGMFRRAGIDPRGPFAFVCQTHIVGNLAAAGKIPRATWRPLLGRFPQEKPNGRTRSEEPDADAA